MFNFFKGSHITLAPNVSRILQLLLLSSNAATFNAKNLQGSYGSSARESLNTNAITIAALGTAGIAFIILCCCCYYKKRRSALAPSSLNVSLVSS